MTELPPPESFDDHTLTEYVETLMLCEDVDHLSIAELASRFPSGQRPTSSDLGLIRSEINRRAHLFPEVYPYRADDAGVERDVRRAGRIYDFLLLLSAESAPYRVERSFNLPNRLFDFLVREAIRSQLGEGSRAVRFGTPVQDGRPESFDDAIEWLAQQMGIARGQRDVLVDENDHGVDVVGWKPFSSGRQGFPVVLTQATLQLDYARKAKDIPVHSWTKMIDIGPAPSTALAIPFTVPDGDDRWMKVSLIVNQLLCRVRICELLASVSLEEFPEFGELIEFVELELEKWQLAIVDPLVKTPRLPKPRRQGPSDHREPLRR